MSDDSGGGSEDGMPDLLDDASDRASSSDDDGPPLSHRRRPPPPRASSSQKKAATHEAAANANSGAPARPAQVEVPDSLTAQFLQAQRLERLATHTFDGILAEATHTEDIEVVKKALEAGKNLENEVKLFLERQNRKSPQTALNQALARVQQTTSELETRLQTLRETEKERKRKQKEQKEQERKEQEIARKKARCLALRDAPAAAPSPAPLL